MERSNKQAERADSIYLPPSEAKPGGLMGLFGGVVALDDQQFKQADLQFVDVAQRLVFCGERHKELFRNRFVD